MSIRLKSIRYAKYLFLGGIVAPTLLSLPRAFSAPTAAVMATKASSSMLLDITNAGSRLVAVGERGHVLSSDDRGRTWTQRPVPMNQMLTAVHFVSEKEGWAVGHDGHVVGSTDGGETWQLLRDGIIAQGLLNEQAVKDSKAELQRLQSLIANGAIEDAHQSSEFAGMSLDEQVDEVSWQYGNAQKILHGSVVPVPLMDVWFSNSKHGYASGAFGGFFVTRDGGKTWEDARKQLPNPDNYHLNTLVGANDGSVYVGGEAGFLVYSLDAGKTWKKADLGYGGTIFSLMANHDGSVIIAAGLRGNTFVSYDRASTWTRLNPGVDFSLAGGAIYGGGNIVLVGSGGTVAISDNKGQTFMQETLMSRASISGVVALNNGDFVMVGQGGVHHFLSDKTNATVNK